MPRNRGDYATEDAGMKALGGLGRWIGPSPNIDELIAHEMLARSAAAREDESSRKKDIRATTLNAAVPLENRLAALPFAEKGPADVSAAMSLSSPVPGLGEGNPIITEQIRQAQLAAPALAAKPVNRSGGLGGIPLNFRVLTEALDAIKAEEDTINKDPMSSFNPQSRQRLLELGDMRADAVVALYHLGGLKPSAPAPVVPAPSLSPVGNSSAAEDLRRKMRGDGKKDAGKR